MAQQNEQNHSLDSTTAPVKRKRGRPRKEDVQNSDPGPRSQRPKHNSTDTARESLIGQRVSGILDGTFDCGFLVSVRLGNSGPLMRGMVFDPQRAVPITPANDVAPHIKMTKRSDFAFPAPIAAQPHQRTEATVPAPIASKVMVNDGSASRKIGSEDVTCVAHSAVSGEAVPAKFHVLDYQREKLPGDRKQDSAIIKFPVNEAAGEQKPDVTSHKATANETGNGPKQDSTSNHFSGTDILGEQKPLSTSQKSLGNETALELKPDPISENHGTITGLTPDPVSEKLAHEVSVTELKPDPVSEKLVDEGTVTELKTDPVSEKLVGEEVVAELKMDSTSQTSQLDNPTAVSEPESNNLTVYNDSDQIKYSTVSISQAETNAVNDVNEGS